MPVLNATDMLQKLNEDCHYATEDSHTYQGKFSFGIHTVDHHWRVKPLARLPIMFMWYLEKSLKYKPPPSQPCKIPHLLRWLIIGSSTLCCGPDPMGTIALLADLWLEVTCRPWQNLLFFSCLFCFSFILNKSTYFAFPICPCILPSLWPILLSKISFLHNYYIPQFKCRYKLGSKVILWHNRAFQVVYHITSTGNLCHRLANSLYTLRPFP